MQISEKQLRANRLNAQKSTGPKTKGGKRISSQNAITHGFFAKAILLPGESVPNFCALHRAYINEYSPTTQEEFDLIETLASTRWRIRRDWTLEAANFALEHRHQTESCAGEDPATNAARTTRALSEPPRSQEAISRHEGRLHRAYNQALDRLHRIQAAKILGAKTKNVETNPQPQQNQQPKPIAEPIGTVDEPSANPQRTISEPESKAA